MIEWSEVKGELAKLRDEVKLQAHLGSKEAQEELHEFEGKWHRFLTDSELRKSEENIRSALRLLGEELKTAYRRIAKAV